MRHMSYLSDKTTWREACARVLTRPRHFPLMEPHVHPQYGAASLNTDGSFSVGILVIEIVNVILTGALDHRGYLPTGALSIPTLEEP